MWSGTAKNIRMLFRINDRNQAWPTPEILLIPEFHDIWVKSKADKTKAVKYFTFIYFLKDFRSPFRRNTVKTEIPKAISEQVLLEPGFYKRVPKYVMNAAEVYERLQTTKSLKLFKLADHIVDQTLTYLQGITPEDIEAKHTNVFKMVKEIPDVVEQLERARKLVESEMKEAVTQTKEGKQLGDRENPRKRDY